MFPHPLNTLQVARPCSADWNAMRGTDRVRHCAACGLHVYDLSAMTAADALALVEQTEGRLCVRFYRRADGTLLTRDCPEAPYDLAHERLKGALFAFAVLSVWMAVTPLTGAAWALAERMLKAIPHALDAEERPRGAGVVAEPTMGEPARDPAMVGLMGSLPPPAVEAE
jgi:hypothetical protein